jgi:hypothetical protein
MENRMADNTIKARIQHLHKTEADWLTFEQEHPEFIVRAGELIIYDIDEVNTTPRFKFGDGNTKLSLLPFIGTNIDINNLEISFDAGRITSYTE